MSQDSKNAPSIDMMDMMDMKDMGSFQELIQSDNQDDFVAAVRLAGSRILVSLHVDEDHYEKVQEEIENDAAYQEIKDSWEDLTTGERTEKWREQLERVVTTAYSSRPYCLRCGECCSRVSPSLQKEDLNLFSEGILHYRDVYTLRTGEPILNNIKGNLDNLTQELIKIKESPESRQCRFYREEDKSCRIYEQRPLQCQAQECWNPQALEQLWNKEKLTRQDLLKDNAELLDLIEVHEQRCSTEKLDDTIKNYWESGETSALDPVVDMLSQDVIIRNFFIEKLGRDEKELNFLLGRPLSSTVESYGLKVEQDENETYHLIQDE